MSKEILSVYAWANLVRLLGISYSQALNPATTSNPDGYLPVYDDAAVYADLLTRLNAQFQN
jgi:hypothetical protein